AGRRPRFASYRPKRKVLQYRFCHLRKSPPPGGRTARLPGPRSALRTGRLGRRDGQIRGREGRFKEPPFFLVPALRSTLAIELQCVDRSFQTDARAKLARPDVGIASAALAPCLGTSAVRTYASASSHSRERRVGRCTQTAPPRSSC